MLYIHNIIGYLCILRYLKFTEGVLLHLYFKRDMQKTKYTVYALHKRNDKFQYLFELQD